MTREQFFDKVCEGMGEFLRTAIAVAATRAKDPSAPTKVEICDALTDLTEILVENVQSGVMDEMLGEVYKLLEKEAGDE